MVVSQQKTKPLLADAQTGQSQASFACRFECARGCPSLLARHAPRLLAHIQSR